MTARVHSLQVVLAHDAREDDVSATISAIMQLRGVISVATINADFESHMAEQRALESLRAQLRAILWPEL